MDTVILALWTIASAITLILPLIPAFAVVVVIVYVLYMLARISCQLDDRHDRK
jgi:hypothetical protein